MYLQKLDTRLEFLQEFMEGGVHEAKQTIAAHGSPLEDKQDMMDVDQASGWYEEWMGVEKMKTA